MSRRQVSLRNTDKSEVSDLRWLIITFVGFVGVIIIVSALLWLTGLFNFTGTDVAAKIMVAALTLVGTLFGATITLVGLMLKRSLDARNLILQTEAEERLKLDTAIKAVELFKSASGSTSTAESAGALFALTRLGQSDFALSLLEQLWPKGLVETPSAIWVINKSLQSMDDGIVELAAQILLSNSELLKDGKGGKSWPRDHDLEWSSELPFLARKNLLESNIISLLSADFGYWNRSCLNVHIVLLTKCFREDLSPVIKQSAAAFLIVLLMIYDTVLDHVLQLPTGDFAIKKVRTEIKKKYGPSFSAGNTQHQELVRRLRAWVKPAPNSETSNTSVSGSNSE